MLLQIDKLAVSFSSLYGKLDVLEEVSLSVKQGEIVGIVGESGSGKSVTALSILGLLDKNAEIKSGSIFYKDQHLLNLSAKEMQAIRGKEIGMVFQEPMTALNPTMKIGKQLANVIRKHRQVGKQESYCLALEALQDVHIHQPEVVFQQYPFQLSGGMRQRVVIALAMSAPPDLLIADEPTTALDVTVQAGILQLMKQLSQAKGTSIILITHDLGVVANTCERVYVMYGGRMVEQGVTADVLYQPRHPYTQGLIASLPEGKPQEEPLQALQGEPFNPQKRPQGCVFYKRCSIRSKVCTQQPPLTDLLFNHQVACWEAERDAASS